MKKWLIQKPTCPHCRSLLRLSQLVQCRFVEEVTTCINNIKSKEVIEKCDEHSAILN